MIDQKPDYPIKRDGQGYLKVNRGPGKMRTASNGCDTKMRIC